MKEIIICTIIALLVLSPFIWAYIGNWHTDIQEAKKPKVIETTYTIDLICPNCHKKYEGCNIPLGTSVVDSIKDTICPHCGCLITESIPISYEERKRQYEDYKRQMDFKYPMFL